MRFLHFRQIRCWFVAWVSYSETLEFRSFWTTVCVCFVGCCSRFCPLFVASRRSLVSWCWCFRWFAFAAPFIHHSAFGAYFHPLAIRCRAQPPAARFFLRRARSCRANLSKSFKYLSVFGNVPSTSKHRFSSPSVTFCQLASARSPFACSPYMNGDAAFACPNYMLRSIANDFRSLAFLPAALYYAATFYPLPFAIDLYREINR